MACGWRGLQFLLAITHILKANVQKRLFKAKQSLCYTQAKYPLLGPLAFSRGNKDVGITDASSHIKETAERHT